MSSTETTSDSSSEKILFFLKTRGSQTADTIAQQLGITSVGARQHLSKLLKKSLVEHRDERTSVGRPKRYWQLTPTGQAQFPNTHSQLTVEMIGSIRDLFGEGGLDKIIAKREADTLKRYSEQLSPYKSLVHKVKKLAELRSAEGYMADYEKCEEGGYYLHENHCPICAAATECQGFCRSELDIFRTALGKKIRVERCEYLLEGARRCSYRIEEKQ